MPVDSIKLDQTDIGILNLLQRDSDLTLKEIAHQLKRNKSVIGRRIEWLRSNHYIKHSVAIIDIKKVKSIFTAFPLIQLRDHNEETFRCFQKLMEERSEVMECHHVMGQYDFLLKIVVADANAYNDFLRTNISPLNYVMKIESFPMLAEIKKETSYRL